jgi:Ni/Co efflux regulator RcnB
LKGYDDPENLLSQLAQFCLIGADPGHQAQYQVASQWDNKHDDRKIVKKKVVKKTIIKKQRWARGNRVPAWQRKQAVRDYHRYGLHRPGRNQQWVRVDNDYLLISIASGLISGIVVGR